MATEKRLIDFEKARKKVMEILAGKISTPVAVKVSLAMQDATVEAVEVVHGRWIETLVPDGYVQKASRMRKQCSVCGWTNACRYHYCPNCGADMRGETE